jgi:polar amino acid transport system substrate-binding protein
VAARRNGASELMHFWGNVRNIMHSTKHWLRIAAATLALGSSAVWGQIDTIEYVKYKGKIVVGVKGDYKPFGYADSTGKIVGLEIDLANDIAKRLGVGVELVPVIDANRLEFLERSRVNMLIATMAYTPDRAKVIDIAEPFYYAGAATVLVKKRSGVENWADLNGKPVCAVQGAHYNDRISEEFGPRLIVFKRVTEAMSEWKSGNCVGVLFDTTFFQGIMGDGWGDYALVLPSIDPAPWGVGVHKGDHKFVAYLSDVIKDWHTSGFIIKLERKWSVAPSTFLIEQQAKHR